MISPLKLIGVNFHGYGSAAYQNRHNPNPPKNYIDDSMRIFSSNGITCIRIPVHWESWEFNRDQFHNDLVEIADAADRYGIMCIYDNHQWECASWIGSGIGFPNSLMARNYERTKRPSSKPEYNLKRDFWGRWWNRKLKTIDGEDGWNAQMTYLLDLVTIVKDRQSTFGFELLNEPAVFSISHYKKIRSYYNYILQSLRKVTVKPMLFCWAAPHRIIDTPMFQAIASPTIKENVIYDCHPYPPSLAYFTYYKLTMFMMGKNIPLYIGEFNSQLKKGTTLSQRQLTAYIKRLRDAGTFGAALWRWSYIRDQNIPAFNLAKVIDDKIEPEDHFIYFVNALKSID